MGNWIVPVEHSLESVCQCPERIQSLRDAVDQRLIGVFVELRAQLIQVGGIERGMGGHHKKLTALRVQQDYGAALSIHQFIGARLQEEIQAQAHIQSIRRHAIQQVIPPDIGRRVATCAAQVFIQGGFQASLPVNRMVIPDHGGEVRILIDACKAARDPLCAIDDRVRPVEQFAARHVAIFDDAARVIGAGEQVWSADDRPPAVCQRGDKQSKREECAKGKIRLWVRKGGRFFVQMIADDEEDQQGNE